MRALALALLTAACAPLPPGVHYNMWGAPTASTETWAHINEQQHAAQDEANRQAALARLAADPEMQAEVARISACAHAEIDAGYIAGYGLHQGWHYSCTLGYWTPISGF